MIGGFTVRGLYEYSPERFSNAFMPPVDKEGNIFIDKELYIQNILLELGDLFLCYPNFDYMYVSMLSWSKCSQYEWTKFVELLKTEYKPLENYNRNENITTTTEYNSKVIKDYTDTGSVTNTQNLTHAKSGDDKNVTTYDTTLKDSGTISSDTDLNKTTVQSGGVNRHNDEKINIGNTQTTSQTVTPNSLTSTTNVSAYNDNVLRPQQSVVQSGSQKTETTVTTVYNDPGNTGNTRDETETYDNLKTTADDTGTITDTHNMSHVHTGTESNTLTHGETLTDSGETVDTRNLSNKGSDTHSGTDTVTIENKTSGNIGVMSSQNMWIQEYDLLPKMNIIDYVTLSFKEKFCLMLY